MARLYIRWIQGIILFVPKL